MKNLKIGTKIMLGFGMVILMMLVITGLVIMTSLNSISNQEKVIHNSELQSLSANLQTDYLNAAEPANLLFGTRDPAIYQEFLELSAATEAGFDEINAFIDANPYLEKYRAQIEVAHASYEEWAANVNILGKLTEDQYNYDKELAQYGGALVETTTTLLNEQTAMLKNEISYGADIVALARSANRLERVISISQDISSARILSRQLTGTHDPAPLAGALEAFDKAIATTTVYYNESQLPTAQREAAKQAIEAITPYRNALEGYGNACVESAAAKDKMPALSLATQTALTEADAAIDLAVSEMTASTTKASTVSLIAVIVISIISLAIAIFLAITIMRGITVPIQSMHHMIEIVGSTGRMQFSNEEMNSIKSAISGDEVGQSISSFVNMLDHLTVVASSLERVADGDLTVDLKPITNEDTIGIAVSTMVEHLNQMFAEINASTEQVSTGSSQIADGAQMLAQGATEQSATVEQLSASVTEVAEQTRTNAAVAEQTRALTDNIKHDAEQGAEQMQQMMQAVQDISDASQSIGKVIKIIDDIAFQTNILALNAAVEAARAGQHGKGFAVVADEVRNLAAKSAAAAKDTGELIETSIKKSEMGASISEDTSQSLGRIVDGVLQSSKLVSDIARSSGEQSIAISQISEAIDQVSQVVQQNSATSEQSAAASEEMSGQAALLKQLISRFKLGNATATASSMHFDGQSTGFAIED